MQTLPAGQSPLLSQQSFDAVTDLFHSVSGIRLQACKRALVTGRLQKLAHQKGCSLDDYVEALTRLRDVEEIVRVVDKLTTNETYFFREPPHFDFLASLLARRPKGVGGDFRVWSAASSSGEEAYSIAMLLGDKLGLGGWEVVGTDLSTQMVETARAALYPMERAQHTPLPYLKRWCLKGHDDYEGHLLICRELRERVHFLPGNLTQDLPSIGAFDVIFLRNVLIYFDHAGKTGIVQRVLTRLKPKGHLFTGHAESISNLHLPVRGITAAVYVHA